MKQGYIGKIPLPPYGSVCYVYTDQEAFVKARGIDLECVRSAGGMTTYTDDHNEFHVLIFQNGIDVLAHECLHVTINLLRHRGVLLSSKSEESFCYLHGYLVGEMYNIICRHYDKMAKKREAALEVSEESPINAPEGEAEGQTTKELHHGRKRRD